MSVIPFPEPDPQVPPLALLSVLFDAFYGIFGDITVGQFLTAMEDLPVRDALKAFIEGVERSA